MLKVSARIHMILALLVTGLMVGAFACIVYSIYSATEVTIPFLGWRIPLFLVFGLAATAITAFGRALGIDLGGSRASVSTGDDGDWDD